MTAIWLPVPAVLGTVALLLATRKGAYASPDSAFYVGVARNLADGHGFTAPPGSVPLSHFPPLFPLLLAAIGWFGIDPLAAAAWVNPLLLGLTAFLVAAMVHRNTGSVAVGATASAAVVVSLDLLVYHGSALSEPLFLLLAVACLAATARYLEAGTGRWLAAAAALAAAATLTRYPGVALTVAGLVAVIRREGVGSSFGRTASRVAAFLAAAVAPTILWFAWAGSGDRAVALHPPGVDYLVGAARSASAWVLSREVGWPARGYAAALVVAVAIALVSQAHRGGVTAEERGIDDVGRERPSPEPLLLVLGAFVAAYLALMLATRTFLDASADLDLRLLLPLHPVAILAAGVGWARLLPAPRRATAWLGVAVVAVNAIPAGSWIAAGLTDDGLARRGLTAGAWSGSEVMAAVSALPPGVDVYSNAPDAIYLITERTARPLPATVDYLTGDPNPDYRAETDGVRSHLASRKAVLAWFDAAAWRRSYLAAEDEVVAALEIPDTPVVDDEVGRLYRP